MFHSVDYSQFNEIDTSTTSIDGILRYSFRTDYPSAWEVTINYNYHAGIIVKTFESTDVSANVALQGFDRTHLTWLANKVQFDSIIDDEKFKDNFATWEDHDEKQ